MKILFVCLGNICRSPLAEGVMRHQADQMDLDYYIDSAGTSDWHIGENPDSRGISVAYEHGIDISNLNARQFVISDFDEFDLIFAMDKSNYSNMMDLARNSNDSKKIKLYLNMAYPGKNMDVPDPYYDGKFEEVFNLLDEANKKVINNIETNKSQ